jgi:hypothetical protein
MNTTNSTTNTWDFEAFLNSDVLATRRNQIKTYDIIVRVCVCIYLIPI